MKFPAFHEVCRNNPDGIKTIWGVSPSDSGQIESQLRKSGFDSYANFTNDNPKYYGNQVPEFLRKLKKRLGQTDPIAEAEQLGIEMIFRLVAT